MIRDKKKEAKSKQELMDLFRALAAETDLFWGLGKYSCKKILADGTVVTFSIKEPK